MSTFASKLLKGSHLNARASIRRTTNVYMGNVNCAQLNDWWNPKYFVVFISK